jgi:hypothetical protein
MFQTMLSSTDVGTVDSDVFLPLGGNIKHPSFFEIQQRHAACIDDMLLLHHCGLTWPKLLWLSSLAILVQHSLKCSSPSPDHCSCSCSCWNSESITSDCALSMFCYHQLQEMKMLIHTPVQVGAPLPSIVFHRSQTVSVDCAYFASLPL